MMYRVEIELVVLFVLLAFGVISYLKLWPQVSSVREVADTLDSRGGIILVLCAMSMIFFFAGMRWLYWSTMLVVDRRLTADNALVLNGFNWISGAAFMGAFGAMLSAMKGQTITVPAPGASTTITQTTSAATTENKTLPDTVSPAAPNNV